MIQYLDFSWTSTGFVSAIGSKQKLLAGFTNTSETFAQFLLYIACLFVWVWANHPTPLPSSCSCVRCSRLKLLYHSLWPHKKFSNAELFICSEKQRVLRDHSLKRTLSFKEQTCDLSHENVHYGYPFEPLKTIHLPFVSHPFVSRLPVVHFDCFTDIH